MFLVPSSELDQKFDKNSGKSFSTSNSGSMSAMMLVNFPARNIKPPYLKVPVFSNQPEAILNVSFSVEWQLNFIELKLNFHRIKL